MSRRVWWLIVAEESAPFRPQPLVVHHISKYDPVEWLGRQEAKYYQESPKSLALRAFWRMDRTPTKAELERLCMDEGLD